MKRIHGYVLLRESNQGIPNLLVCAFDAEGAVQDLLGARRGAERPTLTFGKLGKRIGSVLTGTDGAFELTRDDLHFEGVESRPDLVLAVLAPEDVVDPRRPVALPPEQRILYISAVPRSEAGAEEAYVIRLQQAQLDAFGIALDTSADNAHKRIAATQALLGDVEAGTQIRAQVAGRLHGRLKTQHRREVEFRDQAKKAVQLVALPHGLRAHPLLLSEASKLPDLQKKALTEGIRHLKDAHRPQLRISLRAAELRTAGMKLDRRGKPIGKINTLKLADVLRNMLGGVSLVRKDEVEPSALSDIALRARSATRTRARGAVDRAGEEGQGKALAREPGRTTAKAVKSATPRRDRRK
ncbi:hypothetical protein UB46_39610 [Burkholderiaceae bacterium 16]|nr:hypothetical protein UB46_39610 [Burkholderiaceae bacterium 16]